MKTIGYVLSEFPVLSETFVGNEMRAMMAHGHRVVPIVLRYPQGPAQIDDITLAKSAIYLANVPKAAALRGALAFGFSALSALTYLRRQTSLPRVSLLGNALKIAAVARQHGCTHLHAHFSGPAAAHALVAAKWAGLSVSFVCHGHDVYLNPADLPLKLATADFTVSVCNDMTDDLAVLRPDASVTMVPCGTDPDKFAPYTKTIDNGRLLFIGRLIPPKGLEDLIDAVALAGTAVAPIDIVGDGPLLSKLQARADQTGIDGDRIRFLGQKNAEWIASEGPKYIGLVAPFKRSADGQRDTGPVVVKEAMAMGLPVVGTRSMGMKEMITARTGYLVEPGNVSALAEAIKCLCDLPPAKRRAMGVAGRERVVELFSLTSQAASLSNLVEAA